MTVFKKADYVEGLVLILGLDKNDKSELNKMSVHTLSKIYDGQKANALAYQELREQSMISRTLR